MRSLSKTLGLAIALVACLLTVPVATQQDQSIARRQPAVCDDAARPYIYYNPTTHLWVCSASAPVGYTVASLTATATELNVLHSVVAGTNRASSGLVTDANKSVNQLRTAALYLGTSGSDTLMSATAAELNKTAGVTGGTVTASKAVVVDASKSVDVLQATGSVSVGGTGAPGAAAVRTSMTKAVTAFLDTTAKDVFTVTVPNAAHAAVIEVDCLGVLGAGGAIGAGEATRTSKYQVVLARTAGVNVVATVSSAIGGAEAHVAGGDAITSVVVTVSAISGAVSASNTFTIKVAITRSGSGATNHTGVFAARILNQNATGVTIQ